MASILDVLLIGLAALLAGVFNLSVALKQFQTLTKDLIFFVPARSVGFWVWVLVQLLIPAIAFLFWVTEFFGIWPEIELMLFFKAIGVGIGFTAFLNARTETGFLTIDIQSIYESLSQWGFELIAQRETLRTSRFWRALGEELKQPHTQLDKGLQDLREYFRRDVALKFPERVADQEQFLDQISQALATDKKSLKIDTVVTLLPEVRRQDVIPQLKNFRCREQFLQTYVPRRFHQMAQVAGKRSPH